MSLARQPIDPIRLVDAAKDDGLSEIVDRLREKYKFNPSSTVTTQRGVPLSRDIKGVMYNRLGLKESITLLGESGTKDALEAFNSKMPRILSKVLGRMPGTVGFDIQDDINCANKNFVIFANYLDRNKVSADEGIENFIESLMSDTTYWW